MRRRTPPSTRRCRPSAGSAPTAAATEFAALPERADLLLLAGDLTDRGRLSQAHTLADELGDLSIPIVAVLGNHDYDEGQESQIRALLVSFGIAVLDGSATTVEVRGIRVGVAGTVGFDGGFGTDYDLWHAVRVGKRADPRLQEAATFKKVLAGLRDEQGADLTIALTHFSPVRGTLAGERRRIIPCLGNELLGRTIDEAGADLAVHGHAHFGTERGSTAAGIPVRNVARPVLGRPYAIYPVASVRSAHLPIPCQVVLPVTGPLL
ncbi:MAG TPA: metallophosphoesterase [Actinospica sp.]|nr:metallophosphoesterase [Actinospica sp.]